MITPPNIYVSVCVVIGFVSIVAAVLCSVCVSYKAKAITVYDEEERAVNVTPEIYLWGSERFTRGLDVSVGNKNHQA